MIVNVEGGVAIEDTFAEAFGMKATRLVITADSASVKKRTEITIEIVLEDFSVFRDLLVQPTLVLKDDEVAEIVQQMLFLRLLNIKLRI